MSAKRDFSTMNEEAEALSQAAQAPPAPTAEVLVAALAPSAPTAEVLAASARKAETDNDDASRRAEPSAVLNHTVNERFGTTRNTFAVNVGNVGDQTETDDAEDSKPEADILITMKHFVERNPNFIEWINKFYLLRVQQDFIEKRQEQIRDSNNSPLLDYYPDEYYIDTVTRPTRRNEPYWKTSVQMVIALDETRSCDDTIFQPLKVEYHKTHRYMGNCTRCGACGPLGLRCPEHQGYRSHLHRFKMVTFRMDQKIVNETVTEDSHTLSISELFDWFIREDLTRFYRSVRVDPSLYTKFTGGKYYFHQVWNDFDDSWDNGDDLSFDYSIKIPGVPFWTRHLHMPLNHHRSRLLPGANLKTLPVTSFIKQVWHRLSEETQSGNSYPLAWLRLHARDISAILKFVQAEELGDFEDEYQGELPAYNARDDFPWKNIRLGSDVQRALTADELMASRNYHHIGSNQWLNQDE